MRTILIPFFDDDASQSALSYAVIIANRFNSHIEGMFIAPRQQMAYAGVGVGGGGMALTNTYTTEFAKEGALLAARARSRFESVLAQHNIAISPINEYSGTTSASWRDFDNAKNPILDDVGRVFDLIVVGRGFGHHWTSWNTICESALFECGRPVLITPQQASTIGEHVAIAWNGSTETARTIALSMPMLLEAKKVTVLALDGWSVPRPDGGQLVTNLLRSGIDARLINIDLDGRTPGPVIVKEALGAGADMLVKGAYTQSRLRQLVFGGATRHVFYEANLPVMMAH